LIAWCNSMIPPTSRSPELLLAFRSQRPYPNLNMGDDDPRLPRRGLDGLSQENQSALRLIAATSSYSKTAFGRSFCLLTRSPHSGLPSRPSIRRESINLDTIARINWVVEKSIAHIGGGRWKALTVAAAPINPWIDLPAVLTAILTAVLARIEAILQTTVALRKKRRT